MSVALDGEVLISWRDCNCEWWTKFCDEEHTRHASVRRDELERLTSGRPELQAALGRNEAKSQP